MSQTSLEKWLKFIVISLGLCGGIVYAVLLPLGSGVVSELGITFVNNYLAWMIFLWISGIPCYLVLYFIWKIADEIGKDRLFSKQNANSLKRISQLAAFDSALFFVANLGYFILSISRIGILILSFVVILIGIIITFSAAVLSYFVYKAAKLQEDNDLTI